MLDKAGDGPDALHSSGAWVRGQSLGCLLQKMSQLTTQVKFQVLNRLRLFLLELHTLNKRRPDDLPRDRACSCPAHDVHRERE